MTKKEKQTEAEVAYIKSKIPYSATIFLRHATMSPERNKEMPVNCTITAINEFAIELTNEETGLIDTYSYEHIKKICPRGTTYKEAFQ